MFENRNSKTSFLLIIIAGFLTIILLVGAGDIGATAESNPQPAANTPEGWTAECIDCPRYFTGMSGDSAALDSAGMVHTAYGGDGLYYAVQQPDGSYATEVVDEVPVRGLNAAMVLDSNDQPHILYYAGDFLRLFHAYKDGAKWRFNILSTTALTSLPHPWLAIDDGDNLHLAFISGNDLLYGRYDGSNWQIEAVDSDSSGNIGRPSLTLDSAERPHIAYGRGGQYAYYNGANWQITTFPGTYNEGEDIALALDQNDYAHIAYQTEFNGHTGLDVRYRYYNGTNWQIEDVDEPNADLLVLHTGYDISITFDAAGQPVAVYSVQYWGGHPYPSYEYYVPRLARREKNGWQTEDLYHDSVSLFDSNYTTLLYGPGSSLTFVYKEVTELRAAVLKNDVFTPTIIEVGGDSGTHIDMAVDSEDRLHVSAHEGEYNRLRYGLKSQGSWSIETAFVGAGFESNKWTSLALTTDNRPFIMFDHYGRFGAMPFVYYDGQTWVYEQNELIYNYNFEIAMDSADNFHVAFIESKYLTHLVRNPSGVWEEPVEIDGEIIQAQVQLDITIDSADFPHIAYPATDGLRYAVETPSGWMTETVAAGDVDYPSLALDRFGRPHIAWYEGRTADLMYAAYDGAAWQIETVDSGGDVGRYASLAVDRLGRVYIAYYDAGSADLKYAAFDGQSWTTTTLLSEGDVGSYSKLVMPYAGYPAIAYYDAVSRDLKLLYRPFAPANTAYSPIFTRPIHNSQFTIPN